MRGGGCRFQEWGTDLKTVKIVVLVVKQRDVYIPGGCDQGAEAGFISEQFFGMELAIAADAEENRERRRLRVGRELNVRVETGGSAHCPGNRGPKGLLRCAVPQQTRAGLKLKAGVVVMLDFRPQRQGEPVI